MNILDLKTYQKKRDFSFTTEPRPSKSTIENQPIFVIQKHDASNLHYDLRLEIGEVLVSWAVPKGPSTDPSVKRLALRTENHPREYADFEGVIPQDPYGGGTVIIWDRGQYQNQRNIDMLKSLEEGKIEINLYGQKIKGGYNLIRTPKKKQEQWLLMKVNDSAADARRNPTSTEPESIKSGKTIEQIKNVYAEQKKQN